MIKENPRPLVSFLEDDFELGSRRRRPAKPVKSVQSVQKESKLPGLIKSVLPDAPSVTKSKLPEIKKPEIKKPVKTEVADIALPKTSAVRIMPTQERAVDYKFEDFGDEKDSIAKNAAVFAVRWLVMPVVTVIISLVLYSTIDGFITDWQNERIRSAVVSSQH